MKALTDRLFWVHFYLTDPDFSKNPVNRDMVLEELKGAMAIAEALPELAPIEAQSAPRPHERIIEIGADA